MVNYVRWIGNLLKCFILVYSVLIFVIDNIIVFNVIKEIVLYLRKKCIVYIGFSVCSIFGLVIMLCNFSFVRIKNQVSMIGVNSLLIIVVLCFWIINNKVRMIIERGIIQVFSCGVMIFRFLMVDIIEIVGVMMILL